MSKEKEILEKMFPSIIEIIEEKEEYIIIEQINGTRIKYEKERVSEDIDILKDGEIVKSCFWHSVEDDGHKCSNENINRETCQFVRVFKDCLEYKELE